MKIYQGRTNQGSDEPLCARAVKNALEICKIPRDHGVYFDNFFSSYSLICDLATKGFRATDTMIHDRIMKCPLVDVKKMQKNKQHIVGFMIRQSNPRIISIDPRSTKAHKVAHEMRCDGLGHYPISCSVWKCAFCGKSCRNSCEKCK